jgi:glycine betaine/proline transport system permease protein
MEWLTEEKIPVGKLAKAAFDWLKDNFEWFFESLSTAMETLIDGILWLLITPHPLVIIALFVALTWVIQRNWKTCLLVLIGFAFILNQDYWKETMQSLTLVLSACVVCMGVGVYLIPAIVFFGIGMVPGLIATVIFVLPAPIRLTHLGISSTPVSLLEAARAFGATKRQVLWKVELPSALPQIMAGLNQTIMLSLSMVVIAALVGANGLGVPVMRALGQVNTALGFESGFVIVVVAIILDRMLRMDRK